MKKINQSGPFGRCLAGDATLTIDGKVVGTVSNFKADSVEIEPGDIRPEDLTGEMNFVFASSDRDALKPDNGDRRFASFDLEAGMTQPVLLPHQADMMNYLRDAVGRQPVFKFDMAVLRERMQGATDTGKQTLREYGRRFATQEPAKADNAQMEVYRTMLGEAWPDANTDASLFGKPDIAIEDVSIEEPMRTLQMREEVDLIAAHLKTLPPIPPVPRGLRFLAGGTFGKTSPRPWSHIYQDALDYFDEASSFPDVRLRAFGKSLPGALFRSGDPLKFVGGNYVGNTIIRPGQKRDIAMERVHHHVDHWTVQRRFKGMTDRLPPRARMAIIIHRAFRGPL